MMRLEPDVVVFLTEAGINRKELDDGELFFLDDAGIFVVERNHSYDLFRWSRGEVREPRLVGAPAAVTATYLVLHYGNSWRDGHGLPLVRTVEQTADVPEGFSVIPEPDGSESLCIEGEIDTGLRQLPSGGALRLAHALTIPLEELIASFKHPNGFPSFPMGDPRR